MVSGLKKLDITEHLQTVVEQPHPVQVRGCADVAPPAWSSAGGRPPSGAGDPSLHNESEGDDKR